MKIEINGIRNAPAGKRQQNAFLYEPPESQHFCKSRTVQNKSGASIQDLLRVWVDFVCFVTFRADVTRMHMHTPVVCGELGGVLTHVATSVERVVVEVARGEHRVEYDDPPPL